MRCQKAPDKDHCCLNRLCNVQYSLCCSWNRQCCTALTHHLLQADQTIRVMCCPEAGSGVRFRTEWP